MTQPNDGGPAFPRSGSNYVDTQEGMSLRDWLIGQALAGLCANQASYDMDTIEDRARLAVVQGDETLKLLQEGFTRD